MRLLHVHSGNLYGGVETVLTTLVEGGKYSPAVQHEFALCYPGRLSSELARASAPLHSIGTVRVSRPLTVLRARHELQKLIVEHKFDSQIFKLTWAPPKGGRGAETGGARAGGR